MLACACAGLSNLVSVLPEVLPKQATPVFKTVLPMGNAEEVAFWERMDDVIVGGCACMALGGI